LAVVERAPKVIVAPLIGAPSTVAVTVPDTVPPAPTVVHSAYLNEPMRVFHSLSKACDTGFAYWLVIQNVQPSGSSITEL
jgi:hypothetical protein